MKCAKIIILKVYSNEDVDGAGQSETLIPEIKEGAKALREKINNKDRNQEVLSINLQVSENCLPGNADFSSYVIPEEVETRIAQFAANSDDLGMYILCHSEGARTFAGGLIPSELSMLINSLNIKIKKINLVACHAGKNHHKPDSALKDFCEALTLRSKPVVAAYPYAVFISDNGEKTYSKHISNGANRLVRDGRKTGNKAVKVAYQFKGSKWERMDLKDYSAV